MSDSQLIQVHDVTRRDRRSGRVILDHVSLTIAAGERLGLVGPSGSGKSSLLRIIARLDRCDEGSITFRGEPVSGDAIPPFRRQVLYLPQRTPLLAGSVRKNLQVPFRLASARQPYQESVVAELLDDFGKPISMLDQSADSLSGGEQQIVALIRAMILDPVILLLDEPSASMDPRSTQLLEQQVMKWQQRERPDAESARSLVWTSHDADQIERMTTRVLRMDHGAIRDGAEG